MEKIQFDSGIRSYCINGAGTLRFNPCDPNVYSRFLEAVEKMQAVEEALVKQSAQTTNEDIVKALAAADEKMKGILNWVFGGDNDFQKMLGGVNLLAVAENGERVVTNLFTALEPVLLDGAKRCAGEQARLARQNR